MSHFQFMTRQELERCKKELSARLALLLTDIEKIDLLLGYATTPKQAVSTDSHETDVTIFDELTTLKGVPELNNFLHEQKQDRMKHTQEALKASDVVYGIADLQSDDEFYSSLTSPQMTPPRVIPKHITPTNSCEDSACDIFADLTIEKKTAHNSIFMILGGAVYNATRTFLKGPTSSPNSFNFMDHMTDGIQEEDDKPPELILEDEMETSAQLCDWPQHTLQRQVSDALDLPLKSDDKDEIQVLPILKVGISQTKSYNLTNAYVDSACDIFAEPHHEKIREERPGFTFRMIGGACYDATCDLLKRYSPPANPFNFLDHMYQEEDEIEPPELTPAEEDKSLTRFEYAETVDTSGIKSTVHFQRPEVEFNLNLCEQFITVSSIAIQASLCSPFVRCSDTLSKLSEMLLAPLNVDCNFICQGASNNGPVTSVRTYFSVKKRTRHQHNPNAQNLNLLPQQVIARILLYSVDMLTLPFGMPLSKWHAQRLTLCKLRKCSTLLNRLIPKVLTEIDHRDVFNPMSVAQLPVPSHQVYRRLLHLGAVIVSRHAPIQQRMLSRKSYLSFELGPEEAIYTTKKQHFRPPVDATTGNRVVSAFSVATTYNVVAPPSRHNNMVELVATFEVDGTMRNAILDIRNYDDVVRTCPIDISKRQDGSVTADVTFRVRRDEELSMLSNPEFAKDMEKKDRNGLISGVVGLPWKMARVGLGLIGIVDKCRPKEPLTEADTLAAFGEWTKAKKRGCVTLVLTVEVLEVALPVGVLFGGFE
ncbi:hypothetical protein BC830DRAFT_1120798 [Chytriomyces sp. MP71]|nr:hypothetical protein BC830DRAFT_1120798 [Chytriomyces sp. MP71]